MSRGRRPRHDISWSLMAHTSQQVAHRIVLNFRSLSYSIAPSAWQSPSLKVRSSQVFRFSDFTFLAFWATCGSAWFVRQQRSAAPVSKLSTTVEELPSLHEPSHNKSEYYPSISIVVTSSVKNEEPNSPDWHLVSFVRWFVSACGGCFIGELATWCAGHRQQTQRQSRRYTHRGFGPVL